MKCGLCGKELETPEEEMNGTCQECEVQETWLANEFIPIWG